MPASRFPVLRILALAFAAAELCGCRYGSCTIKVRPPQPAGDEKLWSFDLGTLREEGRAIPEVPPLDVSGLWSWLEREDNLALTRRPESDGVNGCRPALQDSTRQEPRSFPNARSSVALSLKPTNFLIKLPCSSIRKVEGTIRLS